MKGCAKAFFGTIGIVVLVLIIAGIFAAPPKSNQTTATLAAVSTSPSLESLMPETERRFLSAIRSGMTSYDMGANDMQKGAARPARAKEICSIVRPGQISGWLGRVETLSSNGDGNGVLSISLMEKVSVKTWNNSVSDTSDNTLIKPESPLFKGVSGMAIGQTVSFSGVFFPSNTDCLKETSMTLAGAVKSPEFVMRFSDVLPYQLPLTPLSGK